MSWIVKSKSYKLLVNVNNHAFKARSASHSDIRNVTGKVCNRHLSSKRLLVSDFDCKNLYPESHLIKKIHYRAFSKLSTSITDIHGSLDVKLSSTLCTLTTSSISKPVLSLDAIVDTIKENYGLDICVINVATAYADMPADYAIIVSGKSRRHLRMMASVIIQKFKNEARIMKRGVKASLHGEESTDWVIADLGDTVIHFMLPESRQLYNLESLWLLGPEFDEQSIHIAEADSNKEYVWKTTHKDVASSVSNDQ